MQNMPRCCALFDYTAQAHNQISITKGEVLETLQKGEAGGWTKVRCSQGKSPSAFFLYSID
jgi:hypothetical protein